MLVTGATGFLGTSLVRRLLAEGVTVRVLARSREKAKPLIDQGAEAVAGDITDHYAVRSALDRVSVIYNLAGRLLVPGIPNAEYYRTHVEGTRVLLWCARERPELTRFVHCSTTGVLGVTGERPASESEPFAPTNIYESTKAVGEQAVRDTWRAHFPAVIVRPGLVYGPGDLHLLGFFRAIQRHRFRPIGRRPVWLHPIYIEDLTEALVRCGSHPAAAGECFHIAGREPVTLDALAAAIARAAGTTLPPGRIPLPAARAVATLGDWMPPPLKRSAPLTSSRLNFLTHSRVYDVTKAKRILGFVAPTDLATGIALSVAWYQRHHHLATPARAVPA